jgi:hypothetical protein
MQSMGPKWVAGAPKNKSQEDFPKTQGDAFTRGCRCVDRTPSEGRVAPPMHAPAVLLQQLRRKRDEPRVGIASREELPTRRAATSAGKAR